MGNVPTKEDRGGGSSSSRRRGNSIGSTLTGLHHGSSPFPTQRSKNSRRSSTKDKYVFKEAHAAGLVVKYDENVDGGYLAPYGTYNLNLDYKISVVKEAIIQRKIAPFYTPLQDHDKDWTDEELLKVVDSLKLHALPSEAEDEDEDLNYDYDSVDESTLNKKDLKKHLSKKFNKELKLKRLKWQQDEEIRYKREKFNSKYSPSKDLKLFLYRNVMECPICFLYYPRYLNYSRCCVQPICTECFVQIKRLDPHFPHDHDDDIETKAKNDPNLLISEPASCPYCATPNFGVTYTPPTTFKTGMGSDCLPGTFKLPSNQENTIVEGEETSNFDVDDNYFKKQSTISNNPPSSTSTPTTRTRRGSLPANNPTVITTDYIRPDWEQKLNSARGKLARRAATASAIHASNLIIQENEHDVEQRMIEEAVRLSLMEEEARNRRGSSSRR